MPPLPEYDGSPEMREAIRATARRLDDLEIVAPFRQAAEITSFIERERANRNLRLREVKHQRWLSFVSDVTKKGNDPEVLKVAWYWLAENHGKFLFEEYNIRAKEGPSHNEGGAELTINLDDIWSNHNTNHDAKPNIDKNSCGYHAIIAPYIGNYILE